jgi:hypothetical protein
MNYWSHWVYQFVWYHLGTPEEVLIGAAIGLIGAVVIWIVIETFVVIVALPGIFREALALDREDARLRKLAKSSVASDNAPPPTPTSDI